MNLSPALSNDCDADRTVKKPMLHDMFDLLGLPLYNTGLAVFDIWLDDSKENRCNLDYLHFSKLKMSFTVRKRKAEPKAQLSKTHFQY